MEVKDIAALAISSCALVFSGFAIYFARGSLSIARATNQRAVDAAKPIVDPQLPDCDGLGHWMMTVAVKNRHSLPIIIDTIAVTSESAVGIEPYGAIDRVTLPSFEAPSWRGWGELKMRLDPDERRSFEIGIGAARPGRLGNNAPAIFVFTYRVLDDEARPVEAKIRRAANPQ